jgi:Zn-dependent M28 family amino/carboxypeptidase
MDDNAAGLGVMLELAERMKNVPTNTEFALSRPAVKKKENSVLEYP